jgi:hypothetical protein
MKESWAVRKLRNNMSQNLIDLVDNLISDLDELKTGIEELEEECENWKSQYQVLEETSIPKVQKAHILRLETMLHHLECHKEPLDIEELKEISESLKDLIH